MFKFSECKKWLVAGSAMMFAFACQCQTNTPRTNNQCPPKNDCSPCEKPKPAPCPPQKECCPKPKECCPKPKECCPKPKPSPCCSENDEKGSASEEKMTAVETVKEVQEPVVEKSIAPESQNKVEAVLSVADKKSEAAVEAKADLPTSEPVATPSLPVNAAIETSSSSSETVQK